MERTDLMAVLPQQRVEVLDVIRGVALFAVLLVNMMMFRLDYLGFLIVFPDLSGLVEVPALFWDRAATWMILLVFSGRFLPILAILLGLGCYMIMERAEQKGLPARRLLWRRLWLLGGFGILHYVFIWYGDILYSFAVTGVVLLLFMRMNTASLRKWIIGLGIAGVLVAGIFAAILAAILPWLMEALGPQIPKIANYMEVYTEVFRQGSYWEVVGTRALGLLFLLFAPLNALPLLLPFFLVGLYAGKAGIVDSLARGEGPFRRALFPALISAVLGLGISTWIFGATDNPLAWAVGGVLGTIGWVACVLFYICAIVILARSTRFGKLLIPFIPVGQMPLTTYLMQSVIATSIFYGYGLGLAGQVGAAAGVMLTIGIFACQMIFSRLWLKSFAFGPAEWLWRRLLYGRGVPFRSSSLSDAGRAAGG